MRLTRHAFSVAALREADGAAAPGRVALGLAEGVGSAGQAVARVDARPALAGQGSGAVRVASALALGRDGAHACNSEDRGSNTDTVRGRPNKQKNKNTHSWVETTGDKLRLQIKKKQF